MHNVVRTRNVPKTGVFGVPKSFKLAFAHFCECSDQPKIYLNMSSTQTPFIQDKTGRDMTGYNNKTGYELIEC